jgi:hypothetical protein
MLLSRFVAISNKRCITLTLFAMKKLFVFLFAVFPFVTIHAQEHLVFKGVPIDGTLDAYVANMEKAGFTYLGDDDGIAVLQGDFAGFRNCKIGVVTLESMDIVNRISVLFDTHDNWSDLYDNYSSLKEMLTKKYGEYDECIEKFDGYEPRDDGMRMVCLYRDQCKYYTIWETDKGTIELDIIKRSARGRGGAVGLHYWDRINTDLVQEKALEDL